MLEFFNLDDKYANIKLKALPFEENDERFTFYFQEISQITTNFQINSQAFFTVASRIVHYGRLFVRMVDQIWEIGINKNNNSFTNIIDKVDTVLLSISTLADIELELKNSIVSLHAALKNLATFK